MTSKQTTKKPWGGRFGQATSESVEQFTESVSFDYRLCQHDIRGSIAHVRMLGKCGILEQAEVNMIVNGLKQIGEDINNHKFVWKTELEDVHMNIESALIERIGDVGKKLHTGRSRNDQVATDLRLYLRDEVDSLSGEAHKLMSVLVDMADQHVETIMPGFTHLQIAQPVTFGHHMLAWYEMLKRDSLRLVDCRRRFNVLPLGSAALAGTVYPIDREFTARELGFDGISANSLDAVSDRDFVIEFCAVASLIMMHLSRFSEELVLWASPMFGFIELDDAWCTGSSIMPQKKNPDVPELVRGKTGRVFGDLMATLTLMKSQPLAYNRDNQEDKLALFDAVDTLHACLNVYIGMVPSITVKAETMLRVAREGYATATDLADYLVNRGMPFRDAHDAVGRTVNHAITAGKSLSELSLEEIGTFCKGVGQDVFDVLEPSGSVSARDHAGGTAPKQVRCAVRDARHYLEAVKT